MLHFLKNAMKRLVLPDAMHISFTPKGATRCPSPSVASSSAGFCVVGQRILMSYLKPSDRDANTILHYGCCEVAYEITLHDPYNDYSFGRWNRRIEEIRNHISAEHDLGHPTYSLKHDGILKTYGCQDRDGASASDRLVQKTFSPTSDAFHPPQL